ncbi:MAG: hypothetical protein ABI821_18345 [Pseudomonadota bacterium]
MTSRREAETGFQGARFLAGMVALALAACATLPQDHPVYEQLDADTGVTIARIGKPVELYRESVPSVYTDRFAFLAPFETNQMGTREAFLWLALPIDPSMTDTVPTMEVDGSPVAFGTAGREPGFAGLAKSPYKVPAPWSVMFYFKTDRELITRLGAAQSLTIRMMEPTKNGPVEAQFAVKIVSDPRLKEFAARQ